MFLYWVYLVRYWTYGAEALARPSPLAAPAVQHHANTDAKPSNLRSFTVGSWSQGARGESVPVEAT
jgi:hypothetical protein